MLSTKIFVGCMQRQAVYKASEHVCLLKLRFTKFY